MPNREKICEKLDTPIQFDTVFAVLVERVRQQLSLDYLGPQYKNVFNVSPFPVIQKLRDVQRGNETSILTILSTSEVYLGSRKGIRVIHMYIHIYIRIDEDTTS